MKLSGSTRRLFGELCSGGGTVNKIHGLFRSEGFSPADGWEYAESGVRRDAVEAYHEAIDFSDDDQMARLLRVYDGGIEEFGYHGEQGEMALTRDAEALLRALERDGVEVKDGRIVFPDPELSIVAFPLAEYTLLGDEDVEAVKEHLRRIQRGMRNDPASAIGSAKNLLETVCKVILDAEASPYKRRDDLPRLYGKVAAELQLKAESVEESKPGSEAAQLALRSLVTCVQSLGELRNRIGAGHGGPRKSPARSRHAELAFNAARTVSEFLLQTWHVRRGASGFEAMR